MEERNTWDASNASRIPRLNPCRLQSRLANPSERRHNQVEPTFPPLTYCFGNLLPAHVLNTTLASNGYRGGNASTWRADSIEACKAATRPLRELCSGRRLLQALHRAGRASVRYCLGNSSFRLWMWVVAFAALQIGLFISSKLSDEPLSIKTASEVRP